MRISEEQKQNYIDKIYKEMQRRGLTEEEIPRVMNYHSHAEYPMEVVSDDRGDYFS